MNDNRFTLDTRFTSIILTLSDTEKKSIISSLQQKLSISVSVSLSQLSSMDLADSHRVAVVHNQTQETLFSSCHPYQMDPSIPSAEAPARMPVYQTRLVRWTWPAVPGNGETLDRHGHCRRHYFAASSPRAGHCETKRRQIGVSPQHPATAPTMPDFSQTTAGFSNRSSRQTRWAVGGCILRRAEPRHCRPWSDGWPTHRADWGPAPPTGQETASAEELGPPWICSPPCTSSAAPTQNSPHHETVCWLQADSCLLHLTMAAAHTTNAADVDD